MAGDPKTLRQAWTWSLPRRSIEADSPSPPVGIVSPGKGGDGWGLGMDRTAAVEDGDLVAVLKQAKHEDLQRIVDTLAKAWDVTVKEDPRIRDAAGDLTRVPEAVAEHLCRAGGNAVRNLMFGPPSYEQVVRRVCRKLSIATPVGAGVVERERTMLQAIFERAWNEMSPQEREQVVSETLRLAGDGSQPTSATPFP